MRRPLLALLTTVLLGVTACASATADGGPTPNPTPYPTPSGGLGHRPSSPVKITLLTPTNGATITGTSVLVRVSVSGGVVTQTTTSSANITPTKGHVHLYLNNQLIYMSYTLQQLVTNLHPGVEYSMYAEFVAQDHFFFSPRDVTPTIFFTVAPA